MGVCSTSPHVLCGSGEAVRSGSSLCPVEVLWEYVWQEYRSSKSHIFPVHVALQQGFPLSLILFITFMDRISSRNQKPQFFWFGDHSIFSVLFASHIRTISVHCSGLQPQCELAGIVERQSSQFTCWSMFLLSPMAKNCESRFKIEKTFLVRVAECFLRV